jgi:hypothetical protein
MVNPTLKDYEVQLMLVEQQNRRRLLAQRAEQDGILRTSSATTLAPRIDNSPAPQDVQLQIVAREGQTSVRTEAERVEIMEASVGSSNATPVHHNDDGNHAGVQKRKRSNNEDGHSIQTGYFPPGNVANTVTDGVQEVGISPGPTSWTD